MSMRIMRSLGGVLALALAALGATARAEYNYLHIELKGPITPEIKAQIAKVVSPSAAEATGEFARAAESAISVEEFCRRIQCDGRVLAATGVSVEAVAKGELPPDLAEQIDRMREGASSDRFALPFGVVVPSIRIPSSPDRSRTEDFLMVQSGSDLYRAHHGAFARAGVGDAEPAVVPVPVGAGALAPEVVELHGPAAPAIGAVLLDDQATKEIGALEQDIERFGETVRTIPIAPGAGPEDVERLNQLISSSAGSGVTGSAVSVGTPRPAVEIHWPERTLLSATGGTCERPHTRWPFDVTLIKEVLGFDLEVLAAMGQLHPRRSNILIVDSGIASSLSRKAELRPFLYTDTPKLLNHGRYYKGTNVSEPECDHSDGQPSDISIGYVPEEEIENVKTCAQLEPVALLTPPLPTVGDDPLYMPEHGGYVGGIAAGGPELIASGLGIDRLVGISFARIMWAIKAGDAVRSNPSDVALAIEYATRKRVDVLNASLKTTRDPNGAVANAILDYKNQGGLIVAAAGNFGAELQQASQSFPTSIASPEGDDGVIVVGGLQRSEAGDDVEFWPSSAFSKMLVDVAAPAADIVSFDMNGDPVCMSGTSAAAPQVSFVAGVLRALGYWSNAEVKRRILATADYSDDLKEKVRGGRRLNVANALDVFVDLIWLEGSTTPLRVHLLPVEGSEDAVVMQACTETQTGSLAADKGWIDAGQLISWRRLAGDTAEIWHRRTGLSITPLNTTCPAGSSTVRYFDLAAREESEKPLAEIGRIVPSRLRAALPAAKEIILR